MQNQHLIKQRSPELLLQELKAELKVRMEEYLAIVKDVRAEDKDNLRARCSLFAYEDVYSLIVAMEEEEYVDVDPNYGGDWPND